MNELTRHPGGRPTLYCAEVLDAAKFYLQYYKDMEHIVPTIEGLARYLKIGLSTIKGWARDEGKEEFMATLEDIKTEQAFVLINQGLGSEINATIGKLMLANHGYHEKSEHANYDMGGNAHDKAWSVTQPTHEVVALQRIKEERAALEKDIEQLKQDRLAFDGSRDNNNNEQQVEE